LLRLPLSIPFIDLLLTTLVVAAPRFGLRWLYHTTNVPPDHHHKAFERVLIVGAGEGGTLVCEEIRRNPNLGMDAVGFVDDDPRKQHLQVKGLRVLGFVEDIPKLVRKYRVQKVLIAIPTATSEALRHIVDVCHQAEAEVLILPGVYELISGRVRIQRFRPVKVEDLLAREPVQTDTTQIHRLLEGKRVLVTGAGGSIGSELCRQIALRFPAEVVLLGHGENSIFQAHNELRRRFPPITFHPVIADVRDAVRVDHIFARYRPDLVFHAAAHKHVPLMESNPAEAVTNNIGGTRNLLRASEAHDCRNFVMISTDKAVNPTSVMGATKRVAERLVMAAACRTGDRYVAVRFGNVLGSRGSVVPVFEQQIKDGGPVTVTHPEIKRYFMTIPEAVQLVLQAAALGKGGEVFVLDMGEPVKIVDLARDMIRLAGFEDGEDIEITFTGLRPGEKLFEELFLDDEHYQRTLHEKIFVSRNGVAPSETVDHQVDHLLATVASGDVTGILTDLKALVPECHPDFGERARTLAGNG
jgi:FlaA1/EpsC-like NDP-sugar epimerase